MLTIPFFLYSEIIVIPPSILSSFDLRKCTEIIFFNISIASSLLFKAINVETFNRLKLKINNQKEGINKLCVSLDV
jgi:hypothetical protein